MARFTEVGGRPPGTPEKELIGAVLGIADWFAARPETVLFVGVDKLNSARCGIKGGNSE